MTIFQLVLYQVQLIFSFSATLTSATAAAYATRFRKFFLESVLLLISFRIVELEHALQTFDASFHVGLVVFECVFERLVCLPFTVKIRLKG